MPKNAFKNIHGNVFETPNWLFKALNKEFDFQFDLAANRENAKCLRFYTEDENSFEQPWHRLSDGWLWLNPPYSPLKPWIIKTQKENSMGAKIVVLCPPLLFHRDTFKSICPVKFALLSEEYRFCLTEKR